SDNEIFEVSDEIARVSVTLKNMLDDIGAQEDDPDPVPIPTVTGSILRKIIEWATHHKDDPPPRPDEDEHEKRHENIPHWDADFLNVEQSALFEIILAANYLDIKRLLDLACMTVANMIRGRTPEEIRKKFNIINDYTTQEEEQIRRESEWCEDK